MCAPGLLLPSALGLVLEVPVAPHGGVSSFPVLHSGPDEDGLADCAFKVDGDSPFTALALGVPPGGGGGLDARPCEAGGTYLTLFGGTCDGDSAVGAHGCY